MSPKGHFITLEGGDGSGKSSVLEFVYQQLLDRRLPVVKTREPGGTALGNEIRKLLLQTRHGMYCGGRAELLLFLASRAQNVDECILPALNEGKIVLCDRFNDSSIAYQGFARHFGLSEVESICDFASCGIIPSLTLFLDVDPQVGLERVKKTAKQESSLEGLDRIESETLHFHEEVRRAYHFLAERDPQRIVMIDANKPKEEVCRQILTTVLEFLDNNTVNV